jgi:hypothetical protein
MNANSKLTFKLAIREWDGAGKNYCSSHTPPPSFFLIPGISHTQMVCDGWALFRGHISLLYRPPPQPSSRSFASPISQLKSTNIPIIICLRLELTWPPDENRGFVPLFRPPTCLHVPHYFVLFYSPSTPWSKPPNHSVYNILYQLHILVIYYSQSIFCYYLRVKNSITV